MTKKFIFRSNKYNITHQDTQRGIEDRGYVDKNPITSNQASPIDKWYKYSAGRNDGNIFPSSSVNLTRIQIHDAVNRLYSFLNDTPPKIFVEEEISYRVGYNFNKQKIYNLVEEKLLSSPSEAISFTKDPSQFILSIIGIPIKNIFVYEGGKEVPVNAFPILKTNIGEFVGHHKDGRFERGLQGPFTEHNVGGYKHRHQTLGTVSDRPERFKIGDVGSTVTFSAPISGASGLNYNIPYSRFSRDGFVKSATNIRNIRITGANALGTFSKNYQIINGLHRRNQNLALVDSPQRFGHSTLSSPNISGTVAYILPDRRLLDGIYNKTVFVNKFGAPGEIKSTSPNFMDAESEEYSAYNTINYRNSGPRDILKAGLSTPSYFGGYRSGSYGITASYQKAQRNNRRIPTSGTSEFRLRGDNGFVNYQVPARDGGFLWIANYVSGGNNPGLYSNGIDNDIVFITNSVDNIGFSKISSEFYTFSGYVSSIDTSVPSVLRKFIIKFNGLWNFSSKQQLSNTYNKILDYQRKNNIFTDEIIILGSGNKQPVLVMDSSIKDKYSNTKNIYEQDGVERETISYEFAQKYSSIVSNYYDAKDNKLKNFYKDFRNIGYADKSKSTFKRLLDYNRFLEEKKLPGKKIKAICHEEKIFPRGQSVFRNFARIRNQYSQKWSDSLNNRLTELTNSQGQSYARNNFLNQNSDGTYNYSYWPMDASENYNTDVPLIIRDKSGELMQLDNVSRYTPVYGYDPGLITPSGSYFGARFNRNWNTNRPANVVHEQAGRGPYFNSYQEYYSDIKLIGQDCSVIPEYRISPKLDLYYAGNMTIYDDAFNTLELTGTIIEDNFIAIATSSAFIEQRVNSDFIDANSYLNKELVEYKLNSIKFSIKAIKKLLPYDNFYPQSRMVKLAQQFSSSYASSFILSGPQATFRTVLAAVYAPGIGFNSVKSGVGMPYSVVHKSSATAYSDITSSLTMASSFYHKMPWETILSPIKRYQDIPASTLYDVDTDMVIDSTASLNSNSFYVPVYDYMANNFYAEVINFFKEGGTLTKLESAPASEWYFPDLTKKYSLDFVLNRSANTATSTSYEGYGQKPYAFHAPPWYRIGAGAATSSSYNSDKDLSPNLGGSVGLARLKIIFNPSLLAVGGSDYLVKGRFTVGDIMRNSTFEYVSNTCSPNTISGAVQLDDIVNIFSVSSDGQTWQPRLKWECPTTDLNFYGLQAKLTNSSGYDSGGNVAGNSIRGIWHQYASISNLSDGLFLTAESQITNSSLTGSLLDIVGFSLSQKEKVGKIKTRQEISEAIIIIPFYTKTCGEEKYFDIEIDSFERLYNGNLGIIGEIKNISRKYVLPPSLDYIKLRDTKGERLEKDEYGRVKSPCLMFPAEFSSTMVDQDLANIWQGVMPTLSTVATVDYSEKEFFIGNYLKELNFKLPDNTRFKVFKVKKKAMTNYQHVIDKTNGKDYVDLSHGYNWPYDFFSLVEMAEIKAELSYVYDIKEDNKRIESKELSLKTTTSSLLNNEDGTSTTSADTNNRRKAESPAEDMVTVSAIVDNSVEIGSATYEFATGLSDRETFLAKKRTPVIPASALNLLKE